MVVMGLTYALVPPLLGAGATGTELKAAARQLAAGLRKARSEAIARKHEATLLMDIENRRFQVTGDPRVYHLPSKLGIEVYAAQSESATETMGAIRFYPDGSSTGGRITVSANDRKYAVNVNWLTGQVTILE